MAPRRRGGAKPALTAGAVLALAALLALLGACGAAEVEWPSPSYAAVASGAAKRMPGVAGPAPYAPDVAAYSAASAPLARPEDVAMASTRFSLDVAKDVFRSVEGNAVVSPLGVGHLLSLLQQAAEPLSETERQLEQGLHLDRESSLRGLPALLRNAVTKRMSKSVLESGNNLFVKSEWRLKEPFLTTARSQYDANVTSLDFKQTDQSVAAINKWASDATHGRIPQLVSKGALTPDTSLVLTSATYFRGVWKRMFDLGKTAMKTFAATPSRNVTVFMMRQVADFRQGELSDIDAQWIELPFDGDHFSMLLVLPNQRHGLADVLQRFEPRHVAAMLAQPGPGRRTVLYLPRFQLNTNAGLSRTLKRMGMGALFARDAKLRGVAEEPLAVSDILHKAEMKVDEQGATASAASAVLVNTLSLISMEDVKFYADHPFMVMIVDRTTNVPLFLGRVTNPIEGF